MPEVRSDEYPRPVEQEHAGAQANPEDGDRGADCHGRTERVSHGIRRYELVPVDGREQHERPARGDKASPLTTLATGTALT